MLKTRFGIEVEFTGITRNQAAKIVAEHFRSTVIKEGGCYDKHTVIDSYSRKWSIVSDASITTQKVTNGKTQTVHNKIYSVELVSPILEYEKDIYIFQELIRKLRKSGAFTNDSCGIHIHLDGANHTPQSIKNFINIVASKNDLLYKSLQIKESRMRYCKKMDSVLISDIARKNPKIFRELEDIWYDGYNTSRANHYHHSRYHFLNLHSFWTGNHTIELRGFNSELHAGKIRSYIVLALALNHQALTQKCASNRKNQTENEKFAMRTYLNRIGFVGDDFKACRDHLCAHLNGESAWRFGRKKAA